MLTQSGKSRRSFLSCRFIDAPRLVVGRISIRQVRQGIVARQIDMFCVLRLTITGRSVAEHIGGYRMSHNAELSPW